MRRNRGALGTRQREAIIQIIIHRWCVRCWVVCRSKTHWFIESVVQLYNQGGEVVVVEEMGLTNWFRDLGVPWKVSIGILGGVVAVTSAYGLYTFYVHHEEQLEDNKEKSLRGETSSEKLQKKVLVLGLESAGKSTFLAALAHHDSPINSERESTTPTEGFHVVCVSTEGVSLNIWEGKYCSMTAYKGQVEKILISL